MIRTVRYRLLTTGCAPVVNENGDAFDLRAAKKMQLAAPVSNPESGEVKFSSAVIPLGIAMELPKGCKAEVRPRSSTFKKWYIIQSNSVGLIDEAYKGDTDEWGMPVVALKKTCIGKGDRICQFEIKPSQKATLWQKLLWAITTGYRFVEVDTLGNEARGGFGEGTKCADEK